MTTQRLTIERASPFRRRRFVVPHRRRSRSLMLLKPFLLAVILVGLPVAASLWVYSSPRFLLSEVQIGNTVRVPSKEIAAALMPLEGRHLLGVSLAEVEDRLTSNPWITSAAIRKELPNRLVVDVEERYPVALLRRGVELLYVDEQGFVIGAYDLAGPVDLLLLSQAPGASLDVAAALEMAEDLKRVAPRIGEELSEIEALGLDDYRIYSAGLDFPVLLNAGELESQLSKLERLLPEITRRFAVVEAVDLRFSRQIVIQPAGNPRSQEG